MKEALKFLKSIESGLEKILKNEPEVLDAASSAQVLLLGADPSLQYLITEWIKTWGKSSKLGANPEDLFKSDAPIDSEYVFFILGPDEGLRYVADQQQTKLALHPHHLILIGFLSAKLDLKKIILLAEKSLEIPKILEDFQLVQYHDETTCKESLALTLKKLKWI